MFLYSVFLIFLFKHFELVMFERTASCWLLCENGQQTSGTQPLIVAMEANTQYSQTR